MVYKKEIIRYESKKMCTRFTCENYKSLMMIEIKNLTKWRYFVCMDYKTQYC